MLRPVLGLLAIVAMLCATGAHATPLVSLTSFAGTCGGKLVCAGNAAEQGAALRLVPDAPNQSGAAYLSKSIPLAAGQGFVSVFSFRLTGGADAMRADGLAFLLARDPSSLGDPSRYGGSMGFEGVGNSFAVEFDVFDNGGEVGGSNHVALSRDGILSDTAAASPFGESSCAGIVVGPTCMSNGDVWTAIIGYNGLDQELSVAVIDGTGAIDLVIGNYAANLDYMLGGTGIYAGFGAGTGDGRLDHDITSWTMALGNPDLRNLAPLKWLNSILAPQDQVPDVDVPEPASAALLAFGLAALAGAARRRR